MHKQGLLETVKDTLLVKDFNLKLGLLISFMLLCQWRVCPFYLEYIIQVSGINPGIYIILDIFTSLIFGGNEELYSPADIIEVPQIQFCSLPPVFPNSLSVGMTGLRDDNKISICGNYGDQSGFECYFVEVEQAFFGGTATKATFRMIIERYYPASVRNIGNDIG